MNNTTTDNNTLRDLCEAIRNNFFSLAFVFYTVDGIEVRDISTNEVISVFWRPFDAKDYGVASKHVYYRSKVFDEEMQEQVYQSVRMYYFG